MRETLRLEVGALSAEIVPSIGGGVARFDLQRDGEVVEIFRAWPEGGSTDPKVLGMFVMAPWVSRISGGGFTFNGDFHAVASNITGDPLPLHGDAWLEPWPLVSHDPRHVRMIRDSDGTGPFRYRAQMDYGLFSYGLSVRMAIVNTGKIALPFGAGFHPWFPRTPGTRLLAPARTVWLLDEQFAPTEEVPIGQKPDWDFTQARALPPTPINNGFSGWNRKSTIFWDDRNLALDVLPSMPIETYVIYAPGADESFFCFEPVTHAVDAHNLKPGPEAHGLVILNPGEGLVAECRFRVRSTSAS